MNAPPPGEYPAWSAAVTKAVSSIYDLLLQADEEIEALKARVAQLESGGTADAPPQEENNE